MLRERLGKAAHLRHGGGIDRAVRAHGVGGRRPVGRFAPADVIEVVVALERFHLRHLGNDLVHLLGGRGLADGEPEHADVQLAALGEMPIRLVVASAHAASAEVRPGSDAERIQIRHELAGVGEPGVPVGVRNFRGDEGDAAGVADHAGRLAVRVPLDPAARWIRGFFVDARGLERRAVEEAVVIDRLDHDRIVRRDGVEFEARKTALHVGELLLRPAAQHGDPLAGLGALHALGQQFDCALPCGHAVEAQLVVLGGAHPVRVIVDQAGYDGAPLQLDGACLRALVLFDLGVAADGDDALVADRQRLRDREAVVDGDDLAVDENGVRGLRRSRCGARTKQGRWPGSGTRACETPSG